MSAAHRHHELELNLVTGRALTYLISGRYVTVPPGRLCALWGSVPHQAIMDRPGPELIWITVPLSLVLTWKLPRALVTRLLREGIVVERDERAGDLSLLRQWLLDIKDRAGVPSATLLEIEARLFRMALRLGRSRPSAPRRGEGKGRPLLPAAVVTLTRFLADNYQRDVAMQEAARAAHVHPHYAMRLFRRHTNMTLHQYLTLQRVAHAQRLLVTTERTVLDIAFASGFQSVSRFYEAFNRQLGVSPRAYRLKIPRGFRR